MVMIQLRQKQPAHARKHAGSAAQAMTPNALLRIAAIGVIAIRTAGRSLLCHLMAHGGHGVVLVGIHEVRPTLVLLRRRAQQLHGRQHHEQRQKAGQPFVDSMNHGKTIMVFIWGVNHHYRCRFHYGSSDKSHPWLYQSAEWQTRFATCYKIIRLARIFHK